MVSSIMDRYLMLHIPNSPVNSVAKKHLTGGVLNDGEILPDVDRPSAFNSSIDIIFLGDTSQLMKIKRNIIMKE